MPFSRLERKVAKPLRGYTPTPQTIGNHLRNRRVLLKLDQTQVAAKLEVNYRTYVFWENGDIVPRPSHYPAIIRFLGYLPFEIDRTTIAGKVRVCCLLKGVTKLQFSKMLGLEPRMLVKFERGKKALTHEVDKALNWMLAELLMNCFRNP